MSYIIAVAGAGGKSSLIENLADKFAAENKKICITTTTHIYKNNDRKNIFYVGNDEGEKLSYPGDEKFLEICNNYDIILVEADGSKHFPIKIPADYEPVIPLNTNEIFVVMGLNAIGRPVGEVCHRFYNSKISGVDENFIVNLELINFIAEKFYIAPLKKNFPQAKINFIKNNFLKADSSILNKKIALILMASGSSKRFGNENENKLFYNFKGKKLFQWGLDALTGAKKILSEKKIFSQVFITGGNFNLNFYDGVKIIDNPDRLEGISGSIRHSTEFAIKNNFDAVLFFAADMPFFPAENIAGLVFEFLCSKKLCGCAFSNFPVNPGIFDASMFGELLKLSGDSGAMKIIKKFPQKTHYYVVKPEKIFDIDTLNDTANF